MNGKTAKKLWKLATKHATRETSHYSYRDGCKTWVKGSPEWTYGQLKKYYYKYGLPKEDNHGIFLEQ